MQPSREATQPNRRFRHTSKSGSTYSRKLKIERDRTRDEIREVTR